MQTLKSLAAAAALTLLGSASAFATNDPNYTYLTMDAGAGGVFTNTWSFSNLVFSGGPAGSIFDDFYSFNVPDAEKVSFSLTSDLTDSGVGTTSFNGVQDGWALYAFADYSLLKMQYGTDPYALQGYLGLLTSGTYALEVEGEYTVDYGTYTGAIMGVPQVAAVPEPASWTLLLIGAGAIGALGRRRTAPRRSDLAGG
jgi:hypothetical protein